MNPSETAVPAPRSARLRRLAALTCMVGASLGMAGDVLAETLAEVYRLAVQNDPRYRAVQAEAKASATIMDQATAGLLPTAKLELERTRTIQEIISSKNPIFGAGVTSYPTMNKTLSVTQPIFRKDVIERYYQAGAVVRQAGFTLLAAEQDLQMRTMASYLVVLAAKDSVAMASAEREAVRKLLDVAVEKRKMGLGTITQLHDATARFAVTQAREIEAQNKLRDAKQGLAEITGRLIEHQQVLRDDFPLEEPDPANVETWVQSANDQNLVLRARREAVEVARMEIDRQKAGHFPSVNLLFSHNRKDSGSTLYGGGSDVATSDLTLRLTIPIFEGGLTSAVTEEAMHRFHKSQEEFEMERRSVERSARAAYAGALTGVLMVQALRQSVVAQQSALDAKAEGYKAGLNTLLPVLDAQRDLFLARRDYAQARYDYLISRLRLKQAAGTLSEQDLALVSNALQ